MTKNILQKFSEKYISDTAAGRIVQDKTGLLCHLTESVSHVIEIHFSDVSRVYVSTKTLKHLYDKKPAEEYDAILRECDQIIRFPDVMYRNKSGKRGSICFVKTIDKETYFASMEIKESNIFLVTCFRLRPDKKEKYLKNYMSLWNWKDGKPSS